MDLFYGKPAGDKIFLSEEESNHLVHSKRTNIGDTVFVTDGEGHLFTTTIESISKKNCTLTITESKKEKKSAPHLHIAISPTKNIDRIEWFLEKVTEAGVDEISFLHCRHSERKEIKPERLHRILIAAMKQSVKTYIPRLNPMMDFKSFVEKKPEGSKIICSTAATDLFKSNYIRGNTLTVLIGPEGDFHPDEIKSAEMNGFLTTSLGISRLRTETAGITACIMFHFMNE